MSNTDSLNRRQSAHDRRTPCRRFIAIYGVPVCVFLICFVPALNGAKHDALPRADRNQPESNDTTSHYVAVAQLNQGKGLSEKDQRDHIDRATNSMTVDAPSPATSIHHSRSNEGESLPTRSSETQTSNELPLPIGRPTHDGVTKTATLFRAAEDEAFPLKSPTKQLDADGFASNSSFGIPKDKLVAMGSSLAIVLGLFFLFMLFFRRNGNKPIPHLSKDVFEILGRATFVGKQQLFLVRLGNKLTLWSVSGGATKSLVEVDDPQEVDRISLLCQRGQTGRISATFQEILAQVNGDSAKRN